jgi:hypothetical protein
VLAGLAQAGAGGVSHLAGRQGAGGLPEHKAEAFVLGALDGAQHDRHRGRADGAQLIEDHPHAVAGAQAGILGAARGQPVVGGHLALQGLLLNNERVHRQR